ncbi:hypothetical protein [Stenoxybacter acetivorans]|uniref:hypothetical protein n=1 Tax=Stenoxybacter acetivorans TaxID=422441 RepID=UPI0006910BCE|nr:hypothetical protein [Stenoxybacter acetivorans]
MNVFTTHNSLLPKPPLYNRQLAECWQALNGGSKIAVYECLIHITGSLKTAVYLSQLLYWTRVGTRVLENDGWVFKSISATTEETGLSKREQGAAKKKLQELNLISCKRVGMGAKLALRVNLDVLAEAITQQQHGDHTFNNNFYKQYAEADCFAEADYDGDNDNAGTEILDHDLHDLNLTALHNNASLFFRRYFSKRLVYHRDIVRITGCIHSAIMLSYMLKQAVHGCGSQEHHAFAALTISQWQRRIFVSYSRQLTCRNKLKLLKFIIERHFEASRRIFTLICGKNILTAVARLLPIQNVNKTLNTNVYQASVNLLHKAEPIGNIGQEIDLQEENSEISYLPQQDGIPCDSSRVYRNDQSRNSEVTRTEIQKAQNLKFRNDQSRNCYIDFKNYKFINYNHSNGELFEFSINQLLGVVVDEIFSEQALQENGLQAACKRGLQEQDLIFPDFLKVYQANILKIIQQVYPQAGTAAVQEILDEMAGQSANKAIHNPIAYFKKLATAAAGGELITEHAPAVLAARKRAEQHQVMLAEREKREQKEPTKRQSMEENEDYQQFKRNLEKLERKQSLGVLP